jgi:DNA-binding XRE family transcriptional regulator
MNNLVTRKMSAQNSGMDKPFSDQAKRILWHRNLLMLSQAEYGQKAGLKRAAINNYESGDYQIGLAAARSLRSTYGLSLDFIYEGVTDALPMNLRNALLESPADR